MGVRSLTGYLVRPQNRVSKHMTIQEAIEEFHKNKRVCANETAPILLIDGMSCISTVYAGLDWLCQGQWREYLENMREFIAVIREAGAEPVFYFDGALQSRKHDVWTARRVQDADRVSHIYKMLQRSQVPTDALFIIPPSMANMSSLMLKFEFEDVQVHQSVLECDTEIVLLARQLGAKRCVGILSSDTDFIIYNTAGVPFFLLDRKTSCSSLINVYKCDQALFAHRCGLYVDQLPLLACVLGNDSILHEWVREFHAKCKSKPPISKDWFVSLLHDMSTQLRGFQPLSRLDTLERRIFGVSRDQLKDAAGVYWKVLDPVDQSEVGLGLDVLEFKRLLLVEPSDLNSYMPTWLEIPAVTGLPPSVLIFRPVRQRILGLKGKPMVIEFCVYNGGNMKNGDCIESLPLEGLDVKIDQLHEENASADLKWKTLLALWKFPSRKLDHLQLLPDHFQLLAIVLRWIWKNTKLHTWEIIATVQHFCEVDSADGIPDTEPCDLAHVRVMHLGVLLASALQTLSTTLLACNMLDRMHSVMPWKLIDGVLLQNCYRDMKEGRANVTLDQTEQTFIDIIC